MNTSLMWQPTASLKNLHLRAHILATIRQFFTHRNVLEVETPLLSQYTVTDMHIESFTTKYQTGNVEQQTYYLQTSPEYAMKRLLAAGSGAIYQICKAFRNGECGRQHNPEFTILEWYRVGFNHHDLMNEVDEFFQHTLHTSPAMRISYCDLFQQYFNIDPLRCLLQELKQLINHIMSELSQSYLSSRASSDAIRANRGTYMVSSTLLSGSTRNIEDKSGIACDIEEWDRDTCLQFLLSHYIEPKLGHEVPIFIFDFPATQAALAKIRHDGVPVAERFEAYIRGVEMANGFHELADAHEQQQRFEKDLQYRRLYHLPIPSIDCRFIHALEHGLPPCAGVAIGLDRLLMLASNSQDIKNVINFPWDRA